jgi:hypothetical protein
MIAGRQPLWDHLKFIDALKKYSDESPLVICSIYPGPLSTGFPLVLCWILDATLDLRTLNPRWLCARYILGICTLDPHWFCAGSWIPHWAFVHWIPTGCPLFRHWIFDTTLA